jgi:5-methylcytosine-specific restriction endonuclease McrA
MKWKDLLKNLSWAEFKKNILFSLMDRQVYPICGLCAKPIERKDKLTADHMVCRVAGGSDDLYNLQPAHLRCNNKRSDRPLPDTDTSPYWHHKRTGKIIHNENNR